MPRDTEHIASRAAHYCRNNRRSRWRRDGVGDSTIEDQYAIAILEKGSGGKCGSGGPSRHCRRDARYCWSNRRIDGTHAIGSCIQVRIGSVETLVSLLFGDAARIIAKTPPYVDLGISSSAPRTSASADSRPCIVRGIAEVGSIAISRVVLIPD